MSDNLPTPKPAPSTADILASAPKMPPTFYGKVEFHFQAGKLVVAKVEQAFKPD